MRKIKRTVLSFSILKIKKKIGNENKHDSKLFYSEFIFSGNDNKIALLHESLYKTETRFPEMAFYRSLKEITI